jgi:predicted adenylyl cyclase CyaB
MSLNIEVKARVKDRDALRQSLKKITNSSPIQLKQEDTFFRVPKGRLKMRCDEKGHCELIYYRRKNEKGPVLSTFFRQKLSTPWKTREELKQRYGVKNVVRKIRELYQVHDFLHDARIHWDNVESLGDFVEIEILVESPRGTNRGKYAARKLMALLDISSDDVVEAAYEDLLAAKEE